MTADLIRYLRLLTIRRWPWVLGGLLLVVVVSVVFVRNAKMRYAAQVHVMATSPRQSTLALGGIASFGADLSALERDSFILSQETLLHSDTLFTAFSQHFAKPPESTEPGLMRQLRAQIGWLRRTLFGDAYVDTVNKWKNDGFDDFRKAIDFDAQLDAGKFTITYEAEDPEEALRGSEYIAAELIALNIRLANQYNASMSDFLKQKVEETRAKVKASSAQVARFITENKFSDNPKFAEFMYQAFFQSQRALEEASAKVAAGEASAAQVDAFARGLTDAVTRKVNGDQEPELASMIDELGRLHALRTSAIANGDSDAVNDLDGRIAAMRERLRALPRPEDGALNVASVEQLLAQSKSLHSQAQAESAASREQRRMAKVFVDKYSREIERFPELSARLSELLLEQTQQLKTLELLTQQYLMSLLQSDVDLGRLTAAGKAELVAAGLSSSKGRLLALSLLAGMSLLFGLFAWLDYVHGAVYWKKQVAVTDRITVIGQIPRIPLTGGRRGIPPAARELLLHASHALIRKMTRGSQPGRASVLVTSSWRSRAGKSVTAMSLGYILAQQKMRVLLIDCDARAKDRNLIDYAEKNLKADIVRLRDLVASNAVEPLPRDAGQLTVAHVQGDHVNDGEASTYFSTGFRQDLDVLRTRFDYIILDAPPLFVVDSLYLIEVADAALFCVPQGDGRRGDIEQGVASLEEGLSAGKQIFGILTNARMGTEVMDGRYTYRYGRAA